MASAISSPRRMASSSFSRCTSWCTDGATASRATVKSAIIAITATSVIPRSDERSGFAVAILIIFALLLRRRPVGIWRYVARNVVGNSRDTLPRLHLVGRRGRNVGHVTLAAAHARSRRSAAGGPRCRPEKRELVSESEVHVLEDSLVGRNTHQPETSANDIV